jgi:pyruvate dehydrogenase E2 component (dihydrolipoamide acetyltransferase)
MAETVNMPKLGFDMAEGTLVRWVINEGEEVKKGAILAEIETDKATVEVESAYEGIMARHLVSEGDVVPVNTPIAVISAPGEKVEAEAPAAEAKKEPAEAAEPKGEAKVEQVEGGAPLAEAQKEQVEAGKPPGAPQAPPTTEIPQAPAQVEPQPEAGGQIPGGVKASPLARRMAEERGVPLNAIKGSGPDGRITKKDVEAYQALRGCAGSTCGAAPKLPPLPPRLQRHLPLLPSKTIP